MNRWLVGVQRIRGLNDASTIGVAGMGVGLENYHTSLRVWIRIYGRSWTTIRRKE